MSRLGKKQSIYHNYKRNLISATVTSNNGINSQQRLVKIYGSEVSRVDLLNKLKIQSKFTFYWFLTFMTLGLVCLIIDPGNWFNVMDLFIVMFNIYLMAKGKVIGIVIGVIECMLYAFICYKSQLFGEIIKVMCISVPLNIVSIINWVRTSKKQKKTKYKDNSKSTEDDISIKRLTKKGIVLYLALAVVISALSYFFLKYALGQTTALILGSIALMMTIIGKILITQKYMDTWLVFIVSDLICLAMWIQTLITTPFAFSNVTMIIYYLACSSNDSFALIYWKAMYRKITVNGVLFLSENQKRINKIHKLTRMYKVMKWNKRIDEANRKHRKKERERLLEQ